MAKDNVIGLVAKIDTLGLRAGVKEISKYTKEADEAFKNATAGMGQWSKSSEGLTAKLTQLDKELEANKATAAAYKKEIERVSKLEGDNSKRLEELNKKYNAANREIKNTEESIKHYSKSLKNVQKQEKQSNSSLGKLTKTIKEQKEELSDLQNEYKSAILSYGENSDEANNLKNQIEKLNSSLEENENTLKSVEDAASGTAKSFDKAEDETKGFSKGLEGIKKIGAGVAKSVAALGAAAAGIGAAFLSTAGATKEYRTNMGKLETGFETSGLKAEQAAETYKNLYAIVADEGKATEATAMIGQLAKTQEDLNKWVNISTGVYATFGDSLPIESLAEAALETSKTGQITGGLADALNWAGIQEDKFQIALDNCSTEQERQTLITDVLNKTYDEASEKYQQVNKDVIDSNKAQANLTDTMAKLGEKAEPIITKIKEGFTKILEEVLKLTENVDWDAIGESIDNAFAYFIDTIIPAIKNGFQWIMDNKETLLAGIVGIGTAMLAWNVVSIVTGLVTAIKSWTTATTGMTVAQKLLNLAMKANPIGIIITVVAGLVAAIVTLWTTNEDFRNAVINIWNKVKESISKAIETIKVKFEEFKTKAVEVVGNVIEFFKDIPNKIKKGFDKIKEVGKNLVEGLWTGIKDTASWIKKKIKGWVNDRLDDIKGFFGINSPSKETAEMGEYLVEGLEQGIENKTPELTNELEDFAKGVVDTVEDGLKDGDKLGENLAEGIEKNVKKIKENNKELENSYLETAKTINRVLVGEEDAGVKEALEDANIKAARLNVIQQEIDDNSYAKKIRAKELDYEEARGLRDEQLKSVKAVQSDWLDKLNSIYKDGDETKGVTDEYKNLSHFQQAMEMNILNKLESIYKEEQKKYEAYFDAAEEARKVYEATKKVYEPKIKALEMQEEAARKELEAAELKYNEALKRSGAIREPEKNLFETHLEKTSKPVVEETSKAPVPAKVIATPTEKPKVSETITTQKSSGINMDGTVQEMKDSINNLSNEAENGAEKTVGSWFLKIKEKFEDVSIWFYNVGVTIEEALGSSEVQLAVWQADVVSNLEAFVEAWGNSFGQLVNVGTQFAGMLSDNWQSKIDSLDNELAAYKKEKDEELKIYKASELEKQQVLMASLKEGSITQEQYTLQQRESALNLATMQAKLEEQKRIEEEKTLKLKDKLARKKFYADKANKLAEAAANIASGIIEGFKAGPILGPIFAAAMGATGAVQVATIAATKYTPMLAKGGIVDKATLAVVGEDGREAVMPLENNTGWISELAYKLNGIMSKDISSGVAMGAVNNNTVNNTYNYYQTINAPKTPNRRELYRDTKNLLSLKAATT